MNDNATLITTINHDLSLLTLIGFAFVAIWVIDLAFAQLFVPTWKKKMYAVFEKYVFAFGFFVSLFAMIGSLYYSYYLHIPACDLCWLQRIFVYPLVFIFGMAWYKNDRKIFDYVIMFSIIGFAIALYHHYLQLGYDLLKPCSTAPFAVDCATPTFIEYGFVTYPFMAVITFSLTFLIGFTAKRFQK